MTVPSVSLYLPRRHRRPLLFPPGLLALSGLLWLGCSLLSAWQESWRPKRALSLTLPAIPRPGSPKHEFGFYLPSPTEARAMGPWLSAAFTGDPKHDIQEQARVAKLISTMSPDTGVQVRFAPAAPYKHFVFVIDQLKRGSFKRYWVDLHNSPVTINALKINYKRVVKTTRQEFPICGTVSYTPLVISPSALQPHTEAIGSLYLAWLRPLQQPAWQPTAWLLAAIASLSIWRLRRP